MAAKGQSNRHSCTPAPNEEAGIRGQATPLTYLATHLGLQQLTWKNRGGSSSCCCARGVREEEQRVAWAARRWRGYEGKQGWRRGLGCGAHSRTGPVPDSAISRAALIDSIRSNRFEGVDPSAGLFRCCGDTHRPTHRRLGGGTEWGGELRSEGGWERNEMNQY